MLQEDRVSEDVIKIFHNAKGALRNKIEEWTNNQEMKTDYEHNPLKAHWNSTHPQNSFDHAAGDYEPLLSHDEPSLSNERNNYRLKFSTQPSGKLTEQPALKEIHAVPLKEGSHQVKNGNDRPSKSKD